MKNSEIGLTENQEIFLLKVFEKYEFIDTVVVYGSRAKGNYTNRSDLDIVIFGKANDRFELANVLNEIEETSFPYNVDLQLISDIKNQQLLEHINRVGKTFYKRKGIE